MAIMGQIADDNVEIYVNERREDFARPIRVEVCDDDPASCRYCCGMASRSVTIEDAEKLIEILRRAVDDAKLNCR